MLFTGDYAKIRCTLYTKANLRYYDRVNPKDVKVLFGTNE
jgi:hypothetical protein